MSNKEYEEYIHSDKWALKKKEACRIHGRNCFKCGTGKFIHIHHKTYKRLFNENVQIDLIPLCRSCHKRLHKLQRKGDLNLWAATEKFIGGRPIKIKSKRRRIPKMKRSSKRFGKTGRYRRAIAVAPLTRKVKESSHTPHIPYVQKPAVLKRLSVDIHKFMELYGLDEETARALIPSTD